MEITSETFVKNIAYSYIRFSSAAQSEGDSFRRQIRAFGWQLRKPDRHREKEIARQEPLKMLEYAGEKAW